MVEYIEREKAIRAVCEVMQSPLHMLALQTMAGVLQAVCREKIDAIPAADLQPVRHGRWVKTIGENGVTSACRCNLCGFEDNRYSLFNYCPNCGARMDKED